MTTSKRTGTFLSTLILAFLLTGLVQTADAQWQDISPSGATDVHFFGVHFVNDNVGFAVGQNTSTGTGYVYRTTDGGQNWTSTSYTNHHLRTAAFTSEDKGIVSGYDGPPGTNTLHLRTTDQGDTWTNGNNQGYTTGFNGVEFVNGSDGFAYGYGPIFAFDVMIAKTNDGGQSWSSAGYTNVGLIEAIHFFDADTGFMAHISTGFPATGTIQRTVDGGANFVPMYTGAWISDVYFASRQKGFALEGLANKKILTTEDGGQTWTDEPINSNASKVLFVDEEIGFLVGKNGLIMRTEDGGDTWTEETSGSIERLECIHYSDTYVYTTGAGGVVLKSPHGGSTSGPLPLGSPSLTQPANEAIGVGANPTLKWSSIATATEYTVQYAPSADFSTDVETITTSGTSVTASGLDFSTTYYWRARATDGTETSAWSATWSFETKANNSNEWPIGIGGVDEEAGTPSYPNPTTGVITIGHHELFDATRVELTVFDQLGREVAASSFISDGQQQLDLSHMENGIYILRMVSGDQQINERLILQK